MAVYCYWYFVSRLILLLSKQKTAIISFIIQMAKYPAKGLLRDGKPDGYWKNYYENGKLKSEGNRKDFKLDSLWKFYTEKGLLYLIYTYKEGKKNGFKYTYQPHVKR